MSVWNDIQEGDDLVDCPVCLVKVAKKKITNHTLKCLERNKDVVEEMGLMHCPLYRFHVIPKKFLNHHLEGNCEEAANMLRKYFQNEQLRKQIGDMDPPEHFMSDIPKDQLNDHNRKLLYILKRDLDGNDLSQDESLYPKINVAGELEGQ